MLRVWASFKEFGHRCPQALTTWAFVPLEHLPKHLTGTLTHAFCLRTSLRDIFLMLPTPTPCPPSEASPCIHVLPGRQQTCCCRKLTPKLLPSQAGPFPFLRDSFPLTQKPDPVALVASMHDPEIPNQLLLIPILTSSSPVPATPASSVLLTPHGRVGIYGSLS